MFTPIGFFAGTTTTGLPLINLATGYWDANENTDWTDLTGNGNDGTENIVGSGGDAAITHTDAVGGNYWEFSTSNGGTENPYVEVNGISYTLTPSGYTSFFTINARTDSSATDTVQFRHYNSSDTSQFFLGIDEGFDKSFESRLRNTTDGWDETINSAGSSITNNQFYLRFYIYDGDKLHIYINDESSPRASSSSGFVTTSTTLDGGLYFGLQVTSATNPQNMKWGAGGYFPGYALTLEQRTEVFNYYKDIYSFLPPLISSASVYYSANRNTDWTDLTTNGNDGTVGTLGSGGGAAIDHVAGATPYWQFKAPNPLTEQKFLDTNYAKTVSGDYSVMLVISFSDVTTNNIQGVGGLATPSGNASFNIGQNVTERFYHGNKGANAADDLFAYGDTILSTDTFYMVTVVGDSSGIRIYNNNTLDGSDTSNGVTYASSETFVLGRDISLTANYVNNQKVAAYAFFDGVALNATQRTELFDYYNAIYSF